jgi:hypothetical protein
MSEIITLHKIESLLARLQTQDQWGTYYMGKFYFTIHTNKEKKEVGLVNDKNELDSEVQMRLQWENYPALFHEYIHYLHELSSVVGNLGFGLNLCARSIFTNWLDLNPKSAITQGYTSNSDVFIQKYVKATTTKDILFGDSNTALVGRFIEVKSIDYLEQVAYIPFENDFQEIRLNIPKIGFTQYAGNKIKLEYILFGKYFIYEGLAYELDRLVDQQVRGLEKIEDNARGTEYTVLRRLAQYIFPNIDKKTYLCLASVSLQYIDCGNTFISLTNQVKSDCDLGFSQEECINTLKAQTKSLLIGQRNEFIEAQEEYKVIFLKRQQLYKAFGYLINKMQLLYDERIKNPTFEVDYVFDGKHRELLDIAQICDYMYLFNDKIDYMRDFLGTSMDIETSTALKALLSSEDYYSAHKVFATVNVEKTEHTCPFYYCCDLQLRKSNASICKEKPWRIYEVSSHSDHQYCWYGQGVLETKGINEN